MHHDPLELYQKSNGGKKLRYTTFKYYQRMQVTCCIFQHFSLRLFRSIIGRAVTGKMSNRNRGSILFPSSEALRNAKDDTQDLTANSVALIVVGSLFFIVGLGILIRFLRSTWRQMRIERHAMETYIAMRNIDRE